MKKSRFIFIFAIIFSGLFGLAKSSQAACSWNGNIGTAASTSRTDCAACITDAQSKTGNVTIKIPAGSSSTWSSSISVGIGNGGRLSILGAGASTIINHTSATLFSVTINGGSQFFELGNIKTVSSSRSSGGALVSITGTRENRAKFRIHHCEFDHAPYRVYLL